MKIHRVFDGESLSKWCENLLDEPIIISSDENIVDVDEHIRQCLSSAVNKQRRISMGVYEAVSEKMLFRDMYQERGACFRP